MEKGDYKRDQKAITGEVQDEAYETYLPESKRTSLQKKEPGL